MNSEKIAWHFSNITMAMRTAVVMILCVTFAMMVACGKKKPEALPPPVVEVVEVLQKDVPIYEEWIGTADGFVNATIRAQVQGYLIRQNYKEGDLFKKGQTLFEIDSRTFQAAVEQAKGQLAVQQASWDSK